ncbi:Frigida-like protein [Musa troglodytarum]|nr:Frigida-like protein [Musa troglodytarum]URE38910.1 Frigida-like protein [Musa troglodytarum]URE38911.1 Frigida-like protein [Musa troglodytarum]
MEDIRSVATLIDSTTSKIQQLQHAFAELESHNAISLNLKWKELEEHFRGLEKSLKKRFDELEVEENEYVTKVKEAQEMLESREAAVVAKELASLEQLQEQRDAALSALFDTYKTSPPDPIAESVGARNGMTDVISEENSDVTNAKSSLEDVCHAENVNPHTDHPSELVKLCEEMDAEGLHKFISDNRKNMSSIREEMPVALRRAANPFSLVLDSLKGFYAGEILGSDGKKDGNLLGLRRTCLMLMESLEQLLADALPGSLSDKQMLTSDIKEKAKVITKEWKPKLDHLGIEASSGNSLEAHAYLQLLATFDIVSEFDQDEICKLIPAVARRRQTVDLCCSLGLPNKMPGLIEYLLNSGRQIEAVNLACAFKLTEQFPPVPLLKAYLKDARKVAQVKAGSMSPGAQNEMNERELAALKVVIKCIEEHKLEEQYPVDPLQKRIVLLEKAKADKKRVAEVAKPQSKRPRATGCIYTARITSMPDKSFYRALPERSPYPYDMQYAYAAENHYPLRMGSAPYSISPAQTNYYGNSYHVHYQTAYLH